MGTTATRAAMSSPSEAALLARLGLPANADPQAVEQAHAALIDFLGAAPGDLRPWARREMDRADEAFALLSDPTIDRAAAEAADLSAAEPATPRSQTTMRARHATADVAAAVPPAGARPWARRFRRPAILAVGTGALLLVVVAVYNMGGGSGIPGVGTNPVAGTTASPAVDTARVAELMQKIAADPKDVASLQSLADIYYLANDFETSAGFLEKIVAIDPTDLTARLALGASYFNIGKPDRAETQWRAVIARDPNNLEAHYDLGFMYLSRSPADTTAARAEWQKVIAIAPDSDVARTIEQHLASLDTPGSPGPSIGAPSPAASSRLESPGPSAGPSSPAGPAPSSDKGN
jgi:tetratricopeptide (TPR) repeat protein